jgi:DNA primase
MPRIADSTIQELNDKLDAVSVVGEYLVLDKRSGRYWGRCPFHNEKTPSFTVDPDRKLYYCFGCHKGGTIINFVMEMDKLSFPEAVETLAKKSGVAIIYENQGNSEAERQNATQNDELYELYRRVAGSFYHILIEKAEGDAAKQYILGRGISEEMIDRFRLGYAPADRTWLFRFLSGKGYSREFLAASGLFSKKYPEYSFFSHRLMFPIADRQGRTVAFGGRFLAVENAAGTTGETPPEGMKYLNSLESPVFKKGQTLFAIDLAIPEIRRTREAYIAEGYMDAIALHQAAVTNAVAPLGTAFTDDQAKLLRRWAERINLLFDSDEAGQNAAVKAILTCRRNGLSAMVATPEKGFSPAENPGNFKDPADILQYLGSETLQKCVKCVITDFEYLVRRGGTLFDVSTSEGKARAVAFLFPYLETLDSEVSRDACIGDIADAFVVERQAVFNDYGRFERSQLNSRQAGHGQTSRTAGSVTPESQFYNFEYKQEQKNGAVFSTDTLSRTSPVRMNDELFLLVAVLVNHSLVPKLRSTLSIEELSDPRARELFIAIEEWFRHESPGMDDLLSRIYDEPLRNFIIEQSTSKAFSGEPEVLFNDGIKRIKQKGLERRQAEIIVELRSQRREENGRRLEELLVEKVHIDAELRRFKEAKE